MNSHHFRVFRSLKRIHDMFEPDTEDHAVRTGNLAVEIGKHLDGTGSYKTLSEEQLELLNYAVQIHDFGKIFVLSAVVNKPTVLNRAERNMMERHSVLGYDALEFFELPPDALNVVLYHHEHFDGSGYPRGLKGREIPMFARIAALADVWDAINSDRVYRAAMSHTKAIKFMTSHKAWFDPKLFTIFMKIIKDSGNK